MKYLRTGQKEVARIHEEMKKIMKVVKFKSDSLQEFFTFIAYRPTVSIYQ